MKKCYQIPIAMKLLFILLAYNAKFTPIRATKVDFLDQIDATKIENMSTFSFQCQDQMVEVESHIYHLDRFRASLKSVYFERLFTSDNFEYKNNLVLEIQPLNKQVFSAVVDLIHGKKLSDILHRENYLPLLGAMDHLGMEIDLKNFSSFMEQNLTSYSLREAKIFQLYNFIRKNPKFEYLLESVFQHFASDLTTLQNHTIFSSLPLDCLVRIINKVEHLNDEKRCRIIQMCTKWFCDDLENRLFHMATLATSIKSLFHFSKQINISFRKSLPKFDADMQTKRNIISRCLFALLAGKNLDPKKLEIEPDNNLKSSSHQDTKIFSIYNFIKNNVEFEHLSESIFKYFANNLTRLQNYKTFPSLPYDHLIQIIKNIQDPDNEQKYKIIQICTEWLCHDMENRLPYLVNFVISAKSLFHSSRETNTDVSICLPRCHVDEKSKFQIISRCLVALLTNDEHFDPKLLTDDESNYHSDDGYYSEDDERKPYDEKECTTVVNPNDENAKLKKFLNNTDFYDITVRVGEKTYKLHRTILESKCGYFKEYFQAEYAKAVAHCHGSPTCPNKNEEYVMDDKFNSSTFDAIIDYIYFGNFVKYSGWDEIDVIVRIFVTVDALEIQDERLLKYCTAELMGVCHNRVSLQDVVRILNYVHGKTKHADLYAFYLWKHMTAAWPDIYNVSHFCSLSWTMMENIFKFQDLHPDYHNAEKILDICSKWISHDVKNRYGFLPRIAQIINPLCLVDHDKYTTDIAAELNDFSQQSIKDKLWDILSSLPYTRTAELSKNMSEKWEKIPAFIAFNYDNGIAIDIFNVNLDVLESFNVTEDEHSYFTKSTLIGENLFVVSYMELFVVSHTELKIAFFVYNLALKQCFSLRYDFDTACEYNLLNCKNEVYGFSRYGELVKYSMQLNRWMIIYDQSYSGAYSQLTSNGKKLYRTRMHDYWTHNIEAYNFEKNSWHSVPNLPFINHSYCYFSCPHDLTVVNDHDFALSFYLSEIILLHRDSMTWRRYALPARLMKPDSFITQHEDRILFLSQDIIARFFPSNKSFEFIEVPVTKDKKSKYEDITAIHRIIRTDQLL